MTYKIEYSYISEDIKKAYEKFGGFASEERLLFLGFKTKEGFLSGVHMRGGLYGQVSKHFICCGFFHQDFLVPDIFYKFTRSKEKWGYCGLHATNISGITNLKKYKNVKKIAQQDEFVKYLTTGNPLFEYRIDKKFKMTPKLIDYELSKSLPFR